MHFHSRRYPAVGWLVLVFGAAAVAIAALPTFWTLENQPDFLAGEVEGLSIASDGTMSLAPETRSLFDATDPFFWSLSSDRSGNLYAGSGNDGKVYKIPGSGDATVLIDTNELQVHGLAVDREGNVYAGTSPQGSVYKITPDRREEVFFDPDDRYIWALAVDNTGNLLVATGDKGTLYRVGPSGQSETLFESQELHLVCLAVDRDGNVYAGSDSNGLVFKVGPGGRASVLFDTPFQEIHALVVDIRGNVYAAAVNGEGRPTTPPAAVSAAAPGPMGEAQVPTVAGLTDSVTVTVTAQPTGGPTVSAAGAEGLKGAVYKISPEGSVERLWESREDLPLSIRLERDDRVMVGTGKNGRVFLVRQDKTSSLLVRAEADQITSIHSPDGAAVYFATSNPARVYRLSDRRRSEGVYRSPIKDTNAVSSMGKISWEARVPAGTGLTIETRTGNSSTPDNTWSDWSNAYTIPEGDQITSPKGRFLQWRAIFRSADGNGSPELVELTAVYLQQNLRPSIVDVTLHPPGEVFQKPLVATPGQTEILGLDEPVDNSDVPQGGVSMTGMSSTQAALSPIAFARKFYSKGFQTVTWSATDPNDDKLSYDVFYREEGSILWKLLRKDVRDAVVAWDTVAMPDGRYKLKIVASDVPGNPTDIALVGEKESRSFDVDNTPPRVLDIQAVNSQNGHRLTFRAEDDASGVRRVEYAVDSGSWNVVYPTDGICDSRRESFDFAVAGYTEGVHTLVVKVTDVLSNVVTARVELR